MHEWLQTLAVAGLNDCEVLRPGTDRWKGAVSLGSYMLTDACAGGAIEKYRN